VLAATSVLGDLMHKCPPAEACRDAFERMSKATVQMSLSTTGFGSQVDMARVHAGSHGAGSLYPGRARQSMDQRQRGQGSRRYAQNRAQRPVPKFDMNLADLFSDNVRAGQAYPVRPEQAESMASGFPADQAGPSYGQRTQSTEYFMKYENRTTPQPPLQFYYGNSPQQGGSPGSMAANGPHAVAPTDTEAQPGMGLDFLEFGPGDPEAQNHMETDPNAGYLHTLGPNLGQNVGIDLGFGMAVDFQHDWSENPNYDLLEGYFFGGSGPGASGGDA